MQRFPGVDNAATGSAQFTTTHWSVVLLAGQAASSPESAGALEQLCRAYWPPIYYFARRKGHGDADAKDLTQQFFARLIERNDFAGLDPAKGKFRTFLLAAFSHFLANEYDRANALKRGGGKVVIPLEELLEHKQPPAEVSLESTPAADYDRHWAMAVLSQAMERVKAELARAGKQAYFETLKSFLTADGQAADYGAAAERLGVAAASVPVFVHRLRKRYRELVREQVAQTVATPADLEEEMRHLFHVLNQ
jgi:RNA polymerase sigma-70 factor (ECF subfamily)